MRWVLTPLALVAVVAVLATACDSGGTGAEPSVSGFVFNDLDGGAYGARTARMENVGPRSPHDGLI